MTTNIINEQFEAKKKKKKDPPRHEPMEPLTVSLPRSATISVVAMRGPHAQLSARARNCAARYICVAAKAQIAVTATIAARHTRIGTAVKHWHCLSTMVSPCYNPFHLLPVL